MLWVILICQIGTALLWFGWFGFNGGSALSANLRAVQALVVTNLSASVGGIVWMLLDWRLERKFSAIGFCSGAISGLVAITPASGYVGTYSALAIGAVGAAGCNMATRLKYLIHADESLDVFASHGVGGMIGGLMTGLFAESRVAALDGLTAIPGGWLNQNYIQLGYQLVSHPIQALQSLTNILGRHDCSHRLQFRRHYRYLLGYALHSRTPSACFRRGRDRRYR
jgi:Amt family ammonium transporter